MHSQQNQESFHYYGLNNSVPHDSDDLDDLQSPLFRQDLLQSGSCFEAAEKNGGFSNEIDFLAVESFHTEQRGSLLIVPNVQQHEFGGKQDEDMASTLKSSQKSLIFQDQDNEEERERKLIIKTEALTLRSSESEICENFQSYSPKKQRPSAKNHKQKVQPIRQAKQLIRQLKRQYKYNHHILADVMLNVENQPVNIKGSIIQPIVCEKGQLSGLIIKNRDQEFKIKVINKSIENFEPILQIWDEVFESWREFSFKIKLLCD